MVDFETRYYKEFLNSLKTGVKPAIGCTEPVAVGIAVSKAYENLNESIDEIIIKVSPNIFKNGKGVGIPNTKEIGLDFASALAGVCGDADLMLEVFKNVDENAISSANKLIDSGKINLDIERSQGNFYIYAQVSTKNHIGICEIRNSHTNITKLVKDGQVVFEKDYEVCDKSKKENYLHNVKIEDIRVFIEKVPFSDISFLLEGVEVNKNISEYGVENNCGIGLGAHFNKLIDNKLMQASPENMARMIASAACDARMSGVSMPVMSSAGSGNQGIAAIIPVAVVSDEIKATDDRLSRALAFSHIMTAYIKSYTGNLAPVCGCAIAAGIGASSAITWLLGGSDEQIRFAIKNMIGTLSGMFCDGAKGGCAFKIATASSESVIQARLAMANISINDTDGILSPSIEQSIKNLARLCINAMKDVDDEIINIMLEN